MLRGEQTDSYMKTNSASKFGRIVEVAIKKLEFLKISSVRLIDTNKRRNNYLITTHITHSWWF